MKSFVFSRRERLAFGALAIAVSVSAGSARARDDDGSRTFFRDQWAAPTQAAAEAVPQARTPGVARFDSVQRVEDRPVSARPRFRRRDVWTDDDEVKRYGGPASRHGATQYHELTITRRMPADAGQSRVITRFNDLTLRAGDAVMTEAGMRVFAGSRSFPYAERDFVTVDRASGLTKKTKIDLVSMSNQPPR